MKIYSTVSRGSYGFDKSQVKKLILNLLLEQWNGYLSPDVAWGCIQEYINRNRRDYFISQIIENENDDEDDICYSKWRNDVWFGRYYGFRTLKEFNSRIIEDLDDPELILVDTENYTKQWYITIKLGSFYQWHYRGIDYSPQE